jgi:hypothetical protein
LWRRLSVLLLFLTNRQRCCIEIRDAEPMEKIEATASGLRAGRAAPTRLAAVVGAAEPL